ncbi:transcription factor bHLH145-like [Nymphaea colorata]|uniref:BHLH domain-containing protein n=1 Tax=Nymphaea colorata TaxID=210225 RepID=A0A5K0WYR9_9MAGN|nr:transcription factor bHLH145-like [Nymphaea colorata]XP_031497309.1 transcription factor bHLH145-like [Nymphaea colorata]XP_031497311.1 transcription factor bHLH145-like [Nymphaea colorata]XP_049935979.1 transcription factor bHLH145-like [Nymphaea colorata]
MGKDYCSGKHGHFPLQLSPLNYGGLSSDQGLGLADATTFPGGDGGHYCNLSRPPLPINGFAADACQLLNEQFQPWQKYCHNQSLQSPTAFGCQRVQAAAHYDCHLQLKKLDLGAPLLAPATSQKKFVVFDQSGSQRSMFISSINSMSPPLTREHFNQKSCSLPTCPVAKPNVPGYANYTSDDTCWGESKVSAGNEADEMHENTEDLEALLCSEDEDDEVASTGHSPIYVSGHPRKERDEEFTSSTSQLKRRKLDKVEEEGANEEPMMADTASSYKPPKSTDSSCVGDSESCSARPSQHSMPKKNITFATGESFAAKRIRREKIRKTVGILRSILPGGARKDATTVLDETIQYLRSLRLKVRALEGSPW